MFNVQCSMYTHKTFPYFLFRYSLGARNCAAEHEHEHFILPFIIIFSDSVISSRNRSDYALYEPNIDGIMVCDALKLLLLLCVLAAGTGKVKENDAQEMCNGTQSGACALCLVRCPMLMPDVCKTVNLLEVSIVFVVLS